MPPLNTIPAYRATRITTATTTPVKAGTGIVHRIIIGATTAFTITFNDGVGTKLVLGASFPVGSYELNIEFATKIEIVTAGASDITVVWS
jgi:hypothetical protein